MQKRLSRAVVGVFAGLATLCLLSLPASANSLPATITAGSIDIYNADDELVTSVELGGTTTPPCGTTTAMVHATGSSTAGDVWGTIWSIRPVFIGGVEYVSDMTVVFTGTYSNINATTKFVTVVAFATVILHRSSTGNSCEPLTPTTPSCFISVGPILLSGTLSHTGMMPSLTSGDIATLSGGSGPSSLLVTGGASACGILAGANNGYVSVPFLTLSVT